ncbi:DMT family transporter [Paenibacillus psychroresistens]|uniref:DMT family transporter n=1 Tax=Paenibacillus psychroresistens TaxID=1778678 RepID=A0A6B8RVS9_9BACL|nr:DMT family transporter [Paenibacillus psychroresistens]QGQ99356.1 DMT family transporter [Paenibacillus psychroresistens]
MQRLLITALILLSLIWGGSFFFIKQLLQDFGPWTIAFLRSSLGLVTIGMIMLILQKPFRFRKIPWSPMAVMALVNTAIPWAIIGFSETRLTSGMASILNATTPLWTIVVGTLFFQTITNRMQWIGMGIAFIGLIVLLGINPKSIISVDFLGFICMITATLCYAVGSQLSKRLKGVSMYQITFGTLLCSMLGSGSVAFSVEQISLPNLASLTNIVMLIGLGVFGSGIAYILFYFMVQKGSPEFATMVTYFIPASAIIWGSTLLNEQIHWSLLMGLAFILGGVFLASKKRPQQTAATRNET